MATTMHISKIERAETATGVYRIDIYLSEGIIIHFSSLEKMKAIADLPFDKIKSGHLRIWRLLQALRDSGIMIAKVINYKDFDIVLGNIEVII
jgi:hypothetical protein